MNLTNLVPPLTLTTLFINLTITPTPLSAPISPQELFNQFLIVQNSKRVRLNVPPVGAPGSRRGGASRGPCPPVEIPLTALVPETNIGLTVSERPTFWFYIPYNPTPVRSVEFVLLDEKRNAIYQTTLPIKDTPGIMSVSVASSVPPLEAGKRYQWVFSVICDPSNRTEDIFVRGQVKREPLNSSLETQLQATQTERDRIIIYAANGLWYDALTALAKLRHNSPQDQTLANDWRDLLSDVSLTHIASEPLVP